MKEIVFASNNKNKLKEISLALEPKFKVLSLADIGFNEEIEEPYETLRENSWFKASTIYKKFQLPTFAYDTGLEIDELN